jgi:hypothetical protein
MLAQSKSKHGDLTMSSPPGTVNRCLQLTSSAGADLPRREFATAFGMAA